MRLLFVCNLQDEEGLIFISTLNSGSKNFKCFKCGNCCRELGLPWDPVKVEDTIQKIANYLNKTEKEVIENYYGKIVYIKGKKSVKVQASKRTPCPFLSSNNKCKIYPVRPEGCRIYPCNNNLGTQGVDCPGYEVWKNK